MISSIQKTSIFVPSQLPEWIRDDPDNYGNFVAFLQAYYQWMEENGNVLDFTKNIPNYQDIDLTTEQFLSYFVNDFLPYFPQETVVDQRRLVKFAKELYKSKGTPESFKFLFKVLYNSDFEYYYTKDLVLKASDGIWYVPKSLKLATSDENFLNINNFRIYGETTKSIATIENSVVSKNKIEVFISNIELLFQSGEYVHVVDGYNQNVYAYGNTIISQYNPKTNYLVGTYVVYKNNFYMAATNSVGITPTDENYWILVDIPAYILRSKIVGQISQININPNARGLLYQPGDPVVVYGGIENELTGIGATAEVSQITTGSIQRIDVVNGGWGYRSDLNTTINITNAPGAIAIYGTSDANTYYTANATLIPQNAIPWNSSIVLGNTSNPVTYTNLFANATYANTKTTFLQAFTFQNFLTYPISSVYVENGGGGIQSIPTIDAESTFQDYITDNIYTLGSLGILAPIQIANSGIGYVVGDNIQFISTVGFGANAVVTQTNSSGGIANVAYRTTGNYPLGGMGYDINNLPSLNVVSSNTQASGAQLFVPGILGKGATFSPVVDRAGSVTTINILDAGEDYISTPNVSLRVQDIVVTNTFIINLPEKEDTIYQGANINTASYIATVNSISLMLPNENPSLSVYNLRVFNYTTTPNPNLPLKILGKNITPIMANTTMPGYDHISSYIDNSGNYYRRSYNQNGIITYGDGNALATSKFLNGLVIGQGQYLNSQGQPSSFSVLQNEYYNNYTYQITVEKEIAKYRDVLLGLLHPAGMNLIGRFALETENNYNTNSQDALFSGLPLTDYIPGYGASVWMSTDFINKSTNIVNFNIDGANLANIITNTSNTIIEITPTTGPNIRCEVNNINYSTNTVILQNNTWLTFANVAYVQANSGSSVINIMTLTGAYDIINNGNYSNTSYPLYDIVYAGDTLQITGNNTIFTVTNVNPVVGTISVTPNLPAISNSLIAIRRTFGPTSCVRIFGPVGTQYIPEITTEDGITSITTEDGNTLILG
jgi:hypothetical protein